MFERVDSKIVDYYMNHAQPFDDVYHLNSNSLRALINKYVEKDEFYQLDLEYTAAFEANVMLRGAITVPVFMLAVIPRDSIESDCAQMAIQLVSHYGALRGVTNSITGEVAIIMGSLNSIGMKTFEPDLLLHIVSKKLKRESFRFCVNR